MRKLFLLFALSLLYASPVFAQPQINATPVRLVDPASGVSVYPFGSIAFGTTTSGQRGGLFGCGVNTSDPTFANGQFHPCSLTTDGKIRVENGYAEDSAHVSGDKVTLIGCVRNDTPGSLSNTDLDRSVAQCSSNGSLRITGDVSLTAGAAFAISDINGTVNLPTGASTAAKQANFGPAGTPSADVYTVQFVTGGVPFKTYMVDPGTGTALAAAPDTTHDSPKILTGPKMMAECDDSSTDPVNEDDDAAVRVDCNTRALYMRTTDPCSGVKQVFVINIATATTTEAINGAGAGLNVYVCGIFIGPTAGAQNIALVEDDTDNCVSPTAGLMGGVTAASGWNIAANGGTNISGGQSTVAKTTGTNRFVCFISSAAQQTSGTMTYVLAP